MQTETFHVKVNKAQKDIYDSKEIYAVKYGNWLMSLNYDKICHVEQNEPMDKKVKQWMEE